MPAEPRDANPGWVFGLPRVVLARRVAFGAAAFAAIALLVLPKPWSLASGPGLASPSGRPLVEIVLAASWWALLANGLVAILLGAAASLWAPASSRAATSSRRWPRVGASFLVGLLLAVGLAAFLRWPLVSTALWWDEAWSISRAIVGQQSQDPETGEIHFEPMRWSRALWHYRKPTNHVLYSLVARASVSVERSARGGAAHEWSATAFRLPAYLAGLVTVALVGMLLAHWGRPRAGLLAAWLLAIHPWHHRYGVEGRGYAFLILFAALGAWALGRALEQGRIRDWALFAATQVAMLWAHPGGIFLTAGFGIAALVSIARQGAPPGERRLQAARCVVANAVAGMVLVQLLAPNLAQSLSWTEVGEFGPQLTAGSLASLWAKLAVGMRTIDWPPGSPVGDWPTLASLPAVARLAVNAALPLLVGFGVLRLLRIRTAQAPIAAFGVALLAAFGFALWNQAFFYDRFLSYLLVPIVAALAIATTDAGRWLGDRTRPGLALVPILGVGIAYAALAAPQNHVLRTHPMTGLEGATTLLADAAGEAPDAILRAGFGLGGEIPRIYDPRVRYLDTAEELAALVARSDLEGRPLYVLSSYASLNRRRRPEGFRLLDDPAHFEHLARFPGVEPRFSYDVFRHAPSAPTPPSSVPTE